VLSVQSSEYKGQGQGSDFRVKGLEYKGLGCRMWGFRVQVQGLGSRV
jgi:hypothetical protein